LKKLEAAGIVDSELEKTDKRRVNYRLTEKGIDLAPVMLELLIWGARHENTGAPCEVIEHLAQNRAQVLAETRRRWEQHDRRPILPSFESKKGKGRT
jgi:DNA-binding HxlR family transcriptional regulator